MSMEMLDNTTDAFMSEMEAEMNEAAKTAKRRELREGGLRQFKMPKTANSGGTRTATIRYLRPFKDGATVIEHGKFQGARSVCPAEFGFDCEWCAKLMDKWKVSRDELYADANSIAKYCGKAAAGVDFDTKKMWIWDVWYYEQDNPSGDDGAQQLFAWSINPQSPIPPIHKLNTLRFVRPQEGRQPAPITSYDIELTQFGESTKRTFSANDTAYRPFPFEKKVKPLTHDDLRFGYAIAITFDNDAWLQKLQAARKQAATRQVKPAPVKTAAPAPTNDQLDLDLVDE